MSALLQIGVGVAARVARFGVPCQANANLRAIAAARKAWRHRLAVVAAVCIALTPAAGNAAETPDANAVRRAQAIATEAKMLYEQKLYGEAAERFFAAYTLAKRSPLIYNAARAYEKAGNFEKAIALYKAFRDLPDVDAQGRADADARIAQLEKEAADRKAVEQQALAEKQRKERERLAAENAVKEKAAREQQERDRLAKEAQEQQARAKAEKERAEAAKALRRPFPTAAVAATSGFGLVSAGLYGYALSEAAAARALEPKLHTSGDGDAYLGHAQSAIYARNTAIATGILAAGCASWLVWELFAPPSVAPPPKTTIIKTAGRAPAPDWIVAPWPGGLALAGQF